MITTSKTVPLPFNYFLSKNAFCIGLCYRTCFKLEEKKYVDFCLQKKCNGADLSQAAKLLGFIKTDTPSQRLAQDLKHAAHTAADQIANRPHGGH